MNYKLALQAAEAEMRDLLQERSNIDARLGTLKQTIEGLSALIHEPPTATDILANIDGLAEPGAYAGISDAIRALLQVSKVPLSPVQIRGALPGRGFDLTEYANPMSVIHNTLKRLETQGELLTVKDSSGKVVAYTTRYHAEGVYSATVMNTPGTEVRGKLPAPLSPDHPLNKLRANPRQK